MGLVDKVIVTLSVKITPRTYVKKRFDSLKVCCLIDVPPEWQATVVTFVLPSPILHFPSLYHSSPQPQPHPTQNLKEVIDSPHSHAN